MKKLLIVLGIIGLMGGTAYATTQWVIVKKLDNFQDLTSWGFTQHGLKVMKFQDDNTICYVTYKESNGNVSTPAMVCK